MAIARVGASQFDEQSGVNQLQLTRTPGAVGNLMVVGFSVGVGSTVTLNISDTAGNTWNILNTELEDTTNNVTSQSWWCLTNGTSSTTVTVTSNQTQFCIMTLEEFSGVAASPADQAVRSAAGASGTPISPSFTPSVDDVLVWAWCADSLTDMGNIDGTKATAGSNGPAYSGGDGSEYRVLTGRSGISMTAAFVGSGAYTLMAATFKPLAGSSFSMGLGAVGFAGLAPIVTIFESTPAKLVIRKS